MADPERVESTTRYRTTGIVFLVALAVIFLPMLFDGAGVQHSELPPMRPVAPIEPVPAIDDVAPVSDTEARADALRAEVDGDGYDQQTNTAFGAPVLSEPGDDTSVWAVQVASFADETNAHEFRRQLHRDGYNALLSHVRSDGQELIRVAIGPLFERADADALRLELSTAYDLDARLMAFGY